MITGTPDTQYASIRTFLEQRYSLKDSYLERISFFEEKFSAPPEKFAAALNAYWDNFSKEGLREELLVAKFISSSTGKLESELRLRRPKTLNDCVQIANALPAGSITCSAVRQIRRNVTQNSDSNKISASTLCFRCGKSDHLANSPACKAKNATCRNCQKRGHFSSVCKSGNKETCIKTDSIHVSSFTASTSAPAPKCITNKVARPEISVRVGNGADLNFIVDTGSEITVITKSMAERFFAQIPMLPVPTATFRNFDNSSISMTGWFKNVSLCFNNKRGQVDLFVAEVPYAILGVDGIASLGLNIYCSAASMPSKETVNMSDTVATLKLRSDAPVTSQQSLRRLPLALEKPVENEIRRLLSEDVIEPINNFPYISPIVVVPKKDSSIRLCVDYRKINSMLLVDQYPIPSADELLSKLSGATIYSKLDLANAYHNIELSEESRDITAFISSQGLFRFKKLPFGIASAPAIFTRVLQRLLSDCSNVISYFDDILVFASSKPVHDEALAKVKSILHTHKLEINVKKCIYGVPEIEFLGRLLTSKGVQPSPTASKAIVQLPRPDDKKQLRSFLGMVGFYRLFISDFARISAPLYELLSQDTSFQWEDVHQISFTKLKEAVVQSRPLAFFDTSPSTKTFLTTDGSLRGLGAYLSQVHDGEEKPVYFISRKLRPNEQHYSSSEIETLAVLWAVERFHQYLYGRSFEIRSDHSALREVLTGRVRGPTAPARIVRWSTRLLPYTFTVTYVKGRSNVVADGLSRLPLPDDSTKSYDINLAAVLTDTVSCVTYDQVQEETKSDEQLQQVIQFLKTDGWPSCSSTLPSEVLPYYRIRQDFSLHDGILLRGDRIVVPISLRNRLLQFAHEGHFGISKTKARLRLSYWWPGLDSSVETLVRSCPCCKTIPIRDSPVGVPEWPTEPWTTLAMDIAGPKHDFKGNSFYIIGLVDQHSKLVRCHVTTKITSEDVIRFLQKEFNTFGYCLRLLTDNGVQFTSSCFKEYLQKHGIIHIRSAIYNPQCNGSIERVNRNFKKVLENFVREEVPLYKMQEALEIYLLNYNNTPHDTTQKTPSELLLSYRPRTRLEIASKPREPTEEMKTTKITIQKKLMKRAAYADERRRPATVCKFRVGDWVQASGGGPIRRLVRQTGEFTFETSDGYKVNTRTLRLKHRPTETCYAPIKATTTPPKTSPTRRYPRRERRSPLRYGYEEC